MPRRARFTIDDGIYHVMVRGNNQNRIFNDEKDFNFFLELLRENKEKYSLKVYHYVLMDNHAHMIIKSPNGEKLSGAMKRINVTYTRYYRKRYKGIGHFFQDRFKSFLIQNGKYLLECGRYVELNPVRAGIVKNPADYRWSSYKFYVQGNENSIIDVNPEYEGLSEDVIRRRELYKNYVEKDEVERRKEERFFKLGAYGSKEFMEEMKKKGLKLVWSHSGQPKKKANL